MVKQKLILKRLGGLATLLGLSAIVAINWDEIVRNYNEAVWKPNATSLGGISIGDTRSNVIFRKGVGELNDSDEMSEQDAHILLYRTSYTLEVLAKYNETLAVIFDEEDFVREILRYGNNSDLPFTHVEAMKQILGEEDILSISRNYENRRYTYLDWGVSYSFQRNQLTQVSIGEIVWSRVTDSEEYFVKGRKVCPSDDCPWDEEGELKSEYEGKDYREFLTR
jgi:hypothetical protein